MKTVFFLYFSLVVSFCCFAQIQNSNIESEVDLADFGIDSLYNEQLKLKAEQGKLSDCEFGKIIANNDFNKQNYVYYSKEFIGECLYCDVLHHDYNVNWRFSIDLFSDDYYKCYNKEISQLINQKYGFDIFEKASEKADSLQKIKPMSNSYNNYRCVPNLIQGYEKIYIQDSCIEDTLRIRFRVALTFEDSLHTVKPMIVKSVNLTDMDIRSINPSRIIASLSVLDRIDSPLQQYIWDLCSAKVSYWYRYQPYEELPPGERVKYENTIYMAAVFYLVPFAQRCVQTMK